MIKKNESLIENNPIMFISHSGKVWLNEKAEKKLSEKKIDVKEITEWLGYMIKNISELSFRNLSTVMIPIPREPKGADMLILLKDAKEDQKSVLTVMEQRVLAHLVKGLSNKGIASFLEVSPGTVNTHLDNIYRKLDVTNRTAAICAAIRRGLVIPTA